MVHYGYYEDDLPVFGLVKSVFKESNELYFALEHLQNLGFNDHYFGYSYVNILASNEKIVNWN